MEMLLVVMIVGILASVIMARASTAKKKADAARTLASMRSAVGTATTCLDDGNDLNPPVIGTPICAGEDDWPAPIGSGWVYGDFGGCVFEGDVGDSDFTYCANDGTDLITCTPLSCIKT